MDTTTALFFLKFGKKEHLESLQKGNLFMKNFDYFIKLEKENRKKGRGDASEASLVISEVTWTIKDPETDETLFTVEARKTNLRKNEFLLKPIFCLTALGMGSLEVQEEEDDLVKTKIVFTDEQKKEMVNEFGNDVLVIPADKFMQALRQSFENEGLEYVTGKVNYLDYSVNHAERLRAFEDNDPRLLFYKDKSISYQQEFRVVILNRDVEDHFSINIGDMTSFSTILSADKLLNGNYGLQMRLK